MYARGDNPATHHQMRWKRIGSDPSHDHRLISLYEKLEPDTRSSLAGCNQSTILLWAISTEVALKALYAQESGSDPSHDHRLISLYEKLEPDTRSSLETRFQAIRDQRPLYKGRSNSLEDVLTEHNRDFVDWRYVYESIGGRQNQILDLKPAIEAMLAEFEIRDQRLVNC